MASPAASTTLAFARPAPSRSRRNQVTAIIAGIGLAALVLLPWGIEGGPSAWSLALGASSHWPEYRATLSFAPLLIAAAALVVVATLGQHRAVSALAGFGVAWGFGQGF